MPDLDSGKRIHAPTFTLAEIMGFIAALSLAFVWPALLLFPVVSATFAVLLVRSGFKLIEMLAIACVTGVLLGLLFALLPPGHRR